MHIAGHSKKLNQSHSKKHARGTIEGQGLKAFEEGQSMRRESIQNGHEKDTLKAHSKGTSEGHTKIPVEAYTKRPIRRVHGRSNRRIETGGIRKPKLSTFIQISKEDKIPCFWPQLQNFIHGLENVCLWQLNFCLLVPSLLLYISSMLASQKRDVGDTLPINPPQLSKII